MPSRVSRERHDGERASIFDQRDGVSVAPTWRCPHCATLQQETSRCWACLRSAIECGTCRFYRTAIAVDLGFCGLDRDRTPVGREEVRTCWRSDSDTSGDAGLFDERELLPAQPPPARREPDRVPERVRRTSVPGPAARTSGLIEAPHVAPSRRLEPSSSPRGQRRWG